MPVIFTESRARVSKTPPTNTGTMHYPAIMPRGPVKPTVVTSEADVARLFGVWTTTPPTQELAWLIAFFRLKGGRAVVKRRVGPAATYATVILKKGANDSLNVTADSIGGANGTITVDVIPDNTAGTAVIVFKRTTAGDTLTETSPTLASQQAAADWSLNVSLATIDVATTGTQPQWPPTAITAAPLIGGSDDIANVTDSTFAADLAAFDRKTGPGQIPAAGKTSSTVRTALLAHVAGATNKRAILDPAPGTTTSNADGTARDAGIALAAAMRSINGGVRAMLVRGRLIVQGTVSGSALIVPWSIVQCALLSRNDAVTGNPNQAAAGDYGDPRVGPNGTDGAGSYVLGLLDATTDADAALMRGTGLNGVIDAYGDGSTILVDGDETLAPPGDSTTQQFANSRTAMAFKAEAFPLAAKYVHRQIDGDGKAAGQYAGDLIGLCDRYQRIGAIYGNDADPGYVVETGPGVNTPDTINAGQLKARVGLRLSKGATFVFLDIVTYAVNERVA